MALRQEIFEASSPHRIDSDASLPGNATANQKKSLLEPSYRELGQIMLEAERSYFGVGIVLLSPCAQFNKLPLEDFLQQSLVNINTTTLLQYNKDLEASSSVISCEELHIELANNKRYFFPALCLLSCGAMSFAFLLAFGFSQVMATILSLFFASCCGYIACETVRDRYRRASFQKTIEIEIQRRHGRGGTTTTTAIKLNPVCE